MVKAKLVWRLPNKPKRWANVGSAAAAYFEANHFGFITAALRGLLPKEQHNNLLKVCGGAGEESCDRSARWVNCMRRAGKGQSARQLFIIDAAPCMHTLVRKLL